MNDTLSWTDLFNYYFEEIKRDPVDLLGSPMDSIEDEFSDEDDEQQDDEYEEIRSEWMLLMEMGPNTSIDNYSDLGSHEMDRNYDWVGDFRQRHPNINIADVSNFLQQVCNEDNIDAENLIVNTVDFQTLNDKQRLIFKWIEGHYIASITDSNNIEPLRIISMGTAGTEKLYLILTIWHRLLEITKYHDANIKSPILVIAPTGIAAFNIHRTTVHSALSISVNSTNFDISGE
ncbi:2836_t:CDS:1 [Cetraspora pellucida]|uniref:ATP-dependent DNA helicase n=1 Tax=Cetraspora pellucida TaxID=1433469 RepID=A0A9N9IFD2_9GLOM|nr:2836_t:CDS:1 [Cetraspora pellucida]